VSGAYPPVGWISAQRVADLAGEFVRTIQGLRDNGIIADYSQCVLLMHSAKETPRFAGPYVAALNAAGIRVYNPRSKAYVDREEVATAMGALLEIIDPGQAVAQTIRIPGVPRLAGSWSHAFGSAAQAHARLGTYVRASQTAISRLPPNARITPAMPTILYRILSFEPFVTWQQDPNRDARLSKLTRLFEAYCSLVGRPLYSDRQTAGSVRQSWLRTFYYLLMGYLDSTGIDDDEIEEAICPAGRVAIMTIHQAKGLQFPFVFVGAVGISASPGDVHQLEDAVAQFRRTPPTNPSTAADRAQQDLVRMFYVAYARAEHALILLATRSQLAPPGRVACGGQGLGWFNQRVQRL